MSDSFPAQFNPSNSLNDPPHDTRQHSAVELHTIHRFTIMEMAPWPLLGPSPGWKKTLSRHHAKQASRKVEVKLGHQRIGHKEQQGWLA